MKVLVYADDVAFFVQVRSVSNAVLLTEPFCDATAAMINRAKSSGFWFGSSGASPPFYADISWTDTPRKYLGVRLECYRNSSGHFSQSASKLQRRADMLKHNQLSTFGRAAACDLFLVAKLVCAPGAALCPCTYSALSSCICDICVGLLVGTHEKRQSLPTRARRWNLSTSPFRSAVSVAFYVLGDLLASFSADFVSSAPSKRTAVYHCFFWYFPYFSRFFQFSARAVFVAVFIFRPQTGTVI